MNRLTLAKGHPCDIMRCTRFNCRPENVEEHCDTRKMYDRLREYENAEEQGRLTKQLVGQIVKNELKKTDELKPLLKEDLYEMRGSAVLVAHIDGGPMLYGMDRVAAVIDTIPIYGKSNMGIVAIYGRGLTLGDSEYGVTWVAYEYGRKEVQND